MADDQVLLTITQVLEQIVRPHLVGEIEHDCAAVISKDLNEWCQRLRDGTACGTCAGSGGCMGCNGLGCVACDQTESDQDLLGKCATCAGTGERQKEA